MASTILPAVNVVRPFLDWPGPIAMAHRGGASDAPENTLPAFQRAVDLGYRYLETDVHVTADGVVVAFHDDELERTTGRQGRISELTWDEVSTLRVDGREPIPKLTDLLETFPDARFNIDCKEPAAADPLADVLIAADALDRVCVGSFNGRTTRHLRKRLGPRVCTSAGRLDIVLLRVLGWARTPFDAAQVPAKASFFPVVTKRFVTRSHRRGIEVHVWTIDDADEMERLLDLGVDGIMTDRPAVLREVLQRRRQWVER
jgi:glycerophosphoryl diester phosphodiesterase